MRDDASAIEVARMVFDEFRANRRPEHPPPIAMVKNEAGEVIYRFPAN